VAQVNTTHEQVPHLLIAEHRKTNLLKQTANTPASEGDNIFIFVLEANMSTLPGIEKVLIFMNIQ
jgi:hypothetical protein